MNIFVLDESPETAAKYHNDRHTIKMILETAQLLSTAVRLSGVDFGYRITHQNHPCSKWARATKSNFRWLQRLGLALCDEYTYRYGKTHASLNTIKNAPVECIPDGPLTTFAQAMPDEFKHENAVVAYRNYYRLAKQHLLKYPKRDKPDWL
jgi:hypothetical protein